MVRDEYQAIRVVQVHRELSFPLPLCQLMASLWWALWRPEVLETLGGPEFSQAHLDFLRTFGPMLSLEKRFLVEGLRQLLILE